MTRNHDTGRTRDNDDDSLINQTELTWSFGTGGMKHTLLTGLELARERLDRQNYMLDADPLHAGTQAPTSATPLLNPDPFTQLSYTKTPNLESDWPRARPPRSTCRTRWSSTKTLKALLGAALRALQGQRGDHAGHGDGNGAAGTAAFFDRTDNMLSGRAGLIWQPTDTQSYYVSWGNSYNPSGELGVYGATGNAT